MTNGSTKILTVSYGTFSCTLEGFDDPLGSMREMAEYFRDLAADDRYFGAEPPTPDVEMLQRIAEKEVQRRVEARVTDTGVALVAADPGPTPPPASEAPTAPKPDAQQDTAAAAKDPGTSGPLTYDDDFLMADEPEDVLPVDPDAQLAVDGPAESVAEKLRRIRAVVSRNMELEHEAARQEQSPNAGNPDLRDRALSETIQQIQADISGDEADAAAEVISAASTLAGDDDTEDEPADVAIISSDWDFEPELLNTSAEDDTAEDASQAGVSEDAKNDATAAEKAWDDAEDTPKKARTVSEMLGNVSERVADVSDDDDTSEFPSATSRTLSPEPEADVGRLLSETDTKLNDNETVRRRRVISQMRAAVAATKADRLVSRQVTREEQEEAEKNPYREDLSEAVEEGPQPDTPAEADAAAVSSPPLVLVSSQRIDSEPVAPESADAAEFAAQVGAKELPELMEAAAAYAIFSEGQPSFTRPEIMQMVTRMDPSLEMSREDSLRSFGQLLREGKFKKLERGQFTIDQATKYHPDQRAAGT